MQNYSLEANCRLASQEILPLMHVLKVHYHILIPYVFYSHFNNILMSVLTTLEHGLLSSHFSSE
jgi:hypothetical protein